MSFCESPNYLILVTLENSVVLLSKSLDYHQTVPLEGSASKAFLVNKDKTLLVFNAEGHLMAIPLTNQGLDIDQMVTTKGSPAIGNFYERVYDLSDLMPETFQ